MSSDKDVLSEEEMEALFHTSDGEEEVALPEVRGEGYTNQTLNLMFSLLFKHMSEEQVIGLLKELWKLQSENMDDIRVHGVVSLIGVGLRASCSSDEETIRIVEKSIPDGKRHWEKTHSLVGGYMSIVDDPENLKEITIDGERRDIASVVRTLSQLVGLGV